MADLPGLDEAVVVLEDIAPFEVTTEAIDEEAADSDLLFGFGGHAREYVSSPNALLVRCLRAGCFLRT